MNIMQSLFNSLNQPKRPEDIADLIAQELKGQLSRLESQLLQQAAKGSLRQRVFRRCCKSSPSLLARAGR